MRKGDYFRQLCNRHSSTNPQMVCIYLTQYENFGGLHQSECVDGQMDRRILGYWIEIRVCFLSNMVTKGKMLQQLSATPIQ
jgi:hypothetical protein